jgi:hypothetical protein
MLIRGIMVGLVLAAMSLPAAAASKRTKGAKGESPAQTQLRDKCLTLVQSNLCLPKGDGGFNCPASLDTEVDACMAKHGQYP